MIHVMCLEQGLAFRKCIARASYLFLATRTVFYVYFSAYKTNTCSLQKHSNTQRPPVNIYECILPVQYQCLCNMPA